MRLKKIMSALAIPAVCAGVAVYFSAQLYNGAFGKSAHDQAEIRYSVLQMELEALQEQRQSLEAHLALLEPTRIDPDLLDERARGDLFFANENDLIIFNDSK